MAILKFQKESRKKNTDNFIQHFFCTDLQFEGQTITQYLIVNKFSYHEKV